MASSSDLQTAPPIPADATMFTFAAGAMWATLFALLMATVECTVLLVQAWYTLDPSTRLTQIPEGIFFALVAELNWRLFRRSRDRVAVSSQGIWSVRRGGTVYLDWRSVADVKANDSQQKLELIDLGGAAAIRVEYQLKGFESLRGFILSHTAKSTQFASPSAGTFHRSWNLKLVCMAIAAISLFSAWRVHLHGPGPGYFFPLILAAAAFLIILIDPVSVSVGHDAVRINYVCYQRTIPFSSIMGIALSDVRQRGNVLAGVAIQRRGGTPIRLFRIREGSVALYEGLQAAWRSAGEAQGVSLATSGNEAAPAAALPRMATEVRTRPSMARLTGVAVGVIIFTGAALIATLRHSNVGRMIGDALAARYSSAPTFERHRGPIAQLSELKGSGRIYLVQVGEHKAPYSLEDFAQWLHKKYALDVQVLPAMPLDAATWDAKRHQFVAEMLYAQIKQGHPDLAADHDAYLIGFTDGNMYSTREMWGATFSERDSLRTAIISSDEMGDTAWQKAHLNPNGAVERLQARLRRILLKDVAVLYWHLPVNDDRSSLLHNTLNPDLPVEDIFESDLDPALSPQGEQVFEPCIFFTYSAKDGMRPLPGPVIRGCSQVQDPMEDTSVELFELDLRLGLFIDKHTDLYLPDTIPIEFERVTRDGWRGSGPFGISGTNNYDEFLGSADNILIFMEHADGGRDDLMRVPRWMPVQALVKYVGGASELMATPGPRGSSVRRVWQYEMAWHQFPFEHYDVRRFNGGVKTYLPCDSPTVNCYQVGYTDSQGRELRFERDKNRHLTRLTSPNGNWVGVGNSPDGRITAILDSSSRSVMYSYDQRNRLIGVTYPSGAVYRYEYDDTQHMLTFSVSADANSAPSVLLRNEYEHGLLTKQTFADGSVYSYAYDSTDANAIHRATVHTPDHRQFDIEIGPEYSTVKETMDRGSADPQR